MESMKKMLSDKYTNYDQRILAEGGAEAIREYDLARSQEMREYDLDTHANFDDPGLNELSQVGAFTRDQEEIMNKANTSDLATTTTGLETTTTELATTTNVSASSSNIAVANVDTQNVAGNIGNLNVSLGAGSFAKGKGAEQGSATVLKAKKDAAKKMKVIKTVNSLFQSLSSSDKALWKKSNALAEHTISMHKVDHSEKLNGAKILKSPLKQVRNMALRRYAAKYCATMAQT